MTDQPPALDLAEEPPLFIPDYQSLMLPVLRQANSGEVKVADVVARLAEELKLSDRARTTLLASGAQTVFANRVHWAKTYLSKAGLVEMTRRGHFRITHRGRQTLAEDPTSLDSRYLARFDEFRAFSSAGRSSGDSEAVQQPQLAADQTPDEVIRTAHRQIEQTLGQDLLDRVRSAPPEFFERLIVSLLLAMGYGGSVTEAGRALGRSGDDGVDGVVDQDALGLDRVYIQAKRFGAANTVGPGAIRDFFGSLDRHKANKGLFVTTSGFTASARETADYLSKRIVLIDGQHLTRLMIRYSIGCRVEETLHLKKIDEDFFD